LKEYIEFSIKGKFFNFYEIKYKIKKYFNINIDLVNDVYNKIILKCDNNIVVDIKKIERKFKLKNI